MCILNETLNVYKIKICKGRSEKKRNNLLLPLNIKKDKNLVGDSRDTQLGTGMWRERV